MPLVHSEQNYEYFSSWLPSAVHFLTSVPEYQTVTTIARRLSVPERTIEKVLSQLVSMGFVLHRNQKFLFAKGEFHLAKNSPNLTIHHHNWRQRALLDAQDSESESVHFTAVQSFSNETAEIIKSKLLEFIAEYSELAGPSEPEDVYSLALDLFKI